MKRISTFFICLLTAIGVQAQVSSNPYKFLGNITTSYSVDAGGGVPQYYKLWNQITCENESKWSSVEGNRGNFSWGGADNAFNYAKQHNFTYKFHALVWGAQYPGWLDNLPAGERFSAMTNWFNHAKEHYETLPMIDVVNEAVGNHQAGNPMIKETLGGGGKTGYDWLIKAFEMAYERWPDAILIYNDYNSIRWDLDNYITLVQTLRDAGAPIDAYGNQSHEVSDISEDELKNALKKQQDALKMPMFVTELDIDIANDAQQKAQYQKVLPNMWEAPYCAGVTLWGYVLGKTWVGNSGLYRNGTERPAMTWIKEYMQTDAAKNAVGPFPGTKKEASIYIRPASLKVAKDDVLPIKVRARMATKTIEKIDLYAGSDLIATMTEEPYIAEYTASTTGQKTLKAVVTTTDGTTYERLSRIQVTRGTARKPYNDVVAELPGTINVNEYDEGMSGVSSGNMPAAREKITTTATKDGQWMEYTVDVKEEGLYMMEVELASTKTGGMFHLSEYGFDNLTFFTNITEVPNTGSNSEFTTLRVPMTEELTAGRHVFCLNVDKGGFYIKSMTFKLSPVIRIPGTLEMEDFANCSDGIDIINSNDGLVLGNTSNGEWLEYIIDVTHTSSKYSYEAVVSSAASGAKFSITLIDSDGKEKTLGSVSVPQTGSLDSYEVKSGKIRNTIEAGKQKLRINITSGNCNIDKITFTCPEASGISEMTSNEAANGNIYNLSGQKVDAGYKGFIINNGKKVIKR
jgi:GH35 family endo-1,4-beta-xylanase